MLAVEQLSKIYDGQRLLEDVHFSVEKTETVCLLGSSGSGKSTLLKIIAGLEQPDGGGVYWDGKDLAGLPVHQRNFGLMFQEYALFPHRSVAQNVAFGLEMKKENAARICQSCINGLMSTDSTMYVKHFNAFFASKPATHVLIGRIFLIRSSRITIEGEKSAIRVFYRQFII